MSRSVFTAKTRRTQRKGLSKERKRDGTDMKRAEDILLVVDKQMEGV